MEELRPQAEQRTYVNVMESLVAQEIEQQLQHIPARVRRYIKVEEVVTYALNRLPALYASSEKGWEYQRQLAKRDMKGNITDAVRQAIAAVQVDPLRLAKPILQPQNQEAEAVLTALRSLLNVPDLDWSAALEHLSVLKREAQAPGTASSKTYAAASRLPGTYGSNASWAQRRHQRRNAQARSSGRHTKNSGPNPAMGWDDPRYCL